MTDDDDIRDADDGDDGTERRTFVRFLVGFGVGIPILVEGTTFVGLLSDAFGGGSDDDGTASAEAETPSRPTVDVGEDFLPNSEPAEVLVDARLVEDGGRRLRLLAKVTSDLDTRYEFGLGAVGLDDGTEVGEMRTVSVDPDDTATLDASWELPEGTTPTSVRAVGRIGGQSARQYERRVGLTLD